MPLGVPRVPFELFGEEQAFWVDLYNRLYRDRLLFLGADLDDELSNQLVGLIQYLHRENPKMDLTMYINSMGGSLIAGLSIFDMIRSIKARMFTVCIGYASSTASFLLCSGDVRFCFPNSVMMIHQPIGGISGQSRDLDVESHQVDILRYRVSCIYSKITGNKRSLIADDMDRDCFMSPEESIDYGLIDKVLKEIKELPTQTNPREYGSDLEFRYKNRRQNIYDYETE
jgi:ATP-dependent Clp protease, protease subunit